jgi:hypothetical protein
LSISVNKVALREYCASYHGTSAVDPAGAVDRFFAPDAQINIVHPYNEVAGAAGYKEIFFSSLRASFDCLRRSDYIAFGGAFEGRDWVTCTGYYSGHFVKSWLGIQPTGAMAHLRFGEFHRMENGIAVESYIYLDIPELMIATGQWPIVDSPGKNRGFTGYLPGPITLDGLQWQNSSPASSAVSLDMVTSMLRNLATKDQAWRRYWHKDMLWYGPAAFGSFVGVENFADFQVPFEQTFSEWIGGAAPGSLTRHFTRFADGDYICSGGWPSLNAVQVKPFLDQPATGKRLFMRVCDWWRRDEDLLVENWIFVDIPHVLLQMGLDIIEELAEDAA